MQLLLCISATAGLCFRKLVWALDLAGIADMYESYETANLWSFITNTPEGLRVSFVKAEHSNFRWAGPEQAVISSHGHAVHTLHKAGHWVHADNPDGTHLQSCCCYVIMLQRDDWQVSGDVV